MDALITLIHPGDSKETDEKVGVLATVESTGRDEFRDAGEKGYKSINKFTVWAAEYDEQPECEFNGKRLTIYRTFGPRADDKIELYAAERVGNNGR